ncbi:unnamed protein product [Mytilus edulis]|uniref:Uncharacterized protein n=1 Tax=Mytilus edulis TaxID=6550 RepID=A0A8S3R4J1_MYTED|nr:unnamed protein product [Mytilus edulis]
MADFEENYAQIEPLPMCNEENNAQLEPLSMWELLPWLPFPVSWIIYKYFKTNYWREILVRKRKERREPLFKEFFAIQKLINQADPIIIDSYCGLPTKFVEIIGRRKEFAEIHNLSYQEHLKWTVENFKAIGCLQREVEGLNRTRDYLHSQFNDYKSLYYDETAKFRTKRSLFPIIGKALSFLFGTVSDSDLSKIRRNIKTLAQNQDTIRHIVQEGLTILNTTQTHVSENRHKVNELIESVEELGNRLQTFATDIEKQIEVMGSYLQAYLHMDMIIGEIKDLMNIAGDYLNHLQLQLNMLSLGHMSPSLISPDIRDTYDIYKIHNLPVPTKITDKLADSNNMVAQYELEAEVIAANQEKN